MFVIKYVPDKLMEKYTEEVSEFYDSENLTDTYIDLEIRKLYKEAKKLGDLLAMMEGVKGQHPDLMKFYEDRDIIVRKIDILSSFCSHRRNLIIKGINKKLKKQMKI